MHPLTFTGVNFGSYDVFSNAALDSTGNIGVNCPSGVGYSMALSAGGGNPCAACHEQRRPQSQLHTFIPPPTAPSCGATLPAAPLQ